MRRLPSFVTVKRIRPKEPLPVFPPGQVEEAARLLLRTGTLVQPLLLRRSGPDHFDLVSGAFAFQAARRARELDPLEGEMVLSFIVEGPDDEPLLRQLDVLQAALDSPALPVAAPPGQGEASQTGARLAALEAAVAQLAATVVTLGEESRKQTSSLLEAIAASPGRQARPTPAPPADEEQALEIFNRASWSFLDREFRTHGVPRRDQVLMALDAERQLAPFSSLKEIEKRVKGLGKTSVRKLADAWQSVALEPQLT